MTTTDMHDTVPPSGAGAPRPTRVLRRARSGRVGAGVAGGLGRYFQLDPVLFRVLFATAAFFGGAGILAYLLAWAAIPEEGTEHAPIDGWMAALRRRKVPVWLVLGIAALVLWTVAFSWWVPGPFFPVLAIAVLLIAIHGRRQWQPEDRSGVPPVVPPRPGDTVRLTKDAPVPVPDPDRPGWVDDAYAWFREGRSAALERRRRARPVQLATVVVLAVTLATLALIDSITGIPIQTYFWTSLGIVLTGLLVGAVLRRFPLSITWLVPPVMAGVLAFGGSHASFHDGMGERTWTPTGTPASQYRLAFGEGVLDLRSLPTQTASKTVHVTVGAGQVRVIVPRNADITVEANVHIGRVDVRNHLARRASGSDDDGISVHRRITPADAATGAPIVVSVHLAGGRIIVARR